VALGLALGAGQGWAGRAGSGADQSRGSVATDPSLIRPRLPFAAVYGAPAKSLARALGSSEVRRAILEEVAGQGRAAGVGDVSENIALDAAMTALAESLRDDELPALEVLDFLLASYGVVGPSPQLVISRASGSPPPSPEKALVELRQSVASQIRPVLKDAARLDVGAGVATHEKGVVLVVALQNRLLQLDPFPRVWSAKKKPAPLSGTFLGAERKPEVLVTLPSGTTRPLVLVPAEKEARTFRAAVACDAGRGRYQLEIVGQNPKTGNVVLANLPFYCDEAAPEALARPPLEGRTTPTDARTAEKRIAELVNDDRKRAGLPPLILDPAWSAVARAHSQEMASRNTVAHTSPTTGTALDRAKRAGLAPQELLENLGSATSAEEVERGLMSSPGHRQNILDPGVKRMGIGVALHEAGGGAALFVTQLFAAP
jgi:uncharacterized protein YkwD